MIYVKFILLTLTGADGADDTAEYDRPAQSDVSKNTINEPFGSTSQILNDGLDRPVTYGPGSQHGVELDVPTSTNREEEIGLREASRGADSNGSDVIIESPSEAAAAAFVNATDLLPGSSDDYEELLHLLAEEDEELDTEPHMDNTANAACQARRDVEFYKRHLHTPYQPGELV